MAIDAIRSAVNAKNRSFQTSVPDSLGWAIPMATRYIKAATRDDREGNPAYWHGLEDEWYIELTDGSKVIFVRMV